MLCPPTNLVSPADVQLESSCTPNYVQLSTVAYAGISLLPGTKRLKYLEENIGALDVKLTAEEAEELSAAMPEPVSTLSHTWRIHMHAT